MSTTGLDPFQQARTLLVQAYRQLSVRLLQADVALSTTRGFTTHGNDLALWRGQYPGSIRALLFLLTAAEQGGQPFHTFLPLLPDSLKHGELRRISWYEQPIALSLHLDPLPADLLFTQHLGAIVAWSSERGHPQPTLILSDEARQHMHMRDPLSLLALSASPEAKGACH